MKMIKVLGVEIPRYQDCNKCKTKDACSFAHYAYSQPCDKCKNTQEYENEQDKIKEERKTWGGARALKNQEVTGVFQGAGTTFYTNDKGDIVKHEPIKRLANGRK
jgi:hypothetical protein